MQTITFRVDEHQGPAVQQRGVCSVSRDEPQWERILRKKAYMCKTESLCYAAEIDTTL